MAESREDRLEKATPGKEDRPPGPVVSGEIRFAPDSRLNIAYNSNCTNEEEVRTSFVRDIVQRADKGERAFCPRCDQQAMRFVAVKTAIGQYAIGACDKCLYWYLM